MQTSKIWSELLQVPSSLLKLTCDCLTDDEEEQRKPSPPPQNTFPKVSSIIHIFQQQTDFPPFSRKSWVFGTCLVLIHTSNRPSFICKVNRAASSDKKYRLPACSVTEWCQAGLHGIRPAPVGICPLEILASQFKSTMRRAGSYQRV